jgi:eukaryotic-like serine/threonine-protein kinase
MPQPIESLHSVWPQLSLLLDDALALPQDERAAWLDRLSISQPEAAALEGTLRRLLASHADAEFLHTLPRMTQPAAQDARTLAAGTLIGPWQLVREIGAGGMGTVWLAERADRQIKRPVALKLPQSSWAPGLSERLARERDILASLDHPHIARLYDAGLDEVGRPWLALEFVSGRPIDAHVREQALGLRERIALVLQVAAAVSYAHSRSVLHRDLKPANIMVSAEGQVRLLDFGVAKLMQGGQSHTSDLTLKAGRALTPAYASPEQLRGEPLAAASDQYSLAVVAFELLAGALPYDAPRGNAAALQQAIAAGELLRCSAVAPSAASRRALAGDLDAILAKALALQPSDRYDAVDALADDLRHWLQGLPVAARPEPWWRAALRWLRPRRTPLALGLLVLLVLGVALGVGATALAMLALGAGLVAALWQARRANAQAAAARRESARARAVQGFMLDLFRANSDRHPDPQRARQATARELLDLGAARLESALHDAPEARIEVMRTLGEVYTLLQLEGQAVPIWQRRVALAREVHGPASVELAQALIELSSALHATPQRALILPALEEAGRILDALGDRRSVTRGEWYTRMAQCHQVLSLARMQEYADHAVRVLREQPGAGAGADGDDDRLATALHLAARARVLAGEPQAAEALYRESLDQLARLASPPQLHLGQSETALAECLMAQDRREPAIEMLERSLERRHRIFADDDPSLIWAESALALLLHQVGRRIEARELHRSCLERVLRVKGEHDPLYTGRVRLHCARSWAAEGRLAEAQRLAEQVVTVRRAHYAQALVLANSLREWACILTALGRFDAARALFEEALPMAQTNAAGAAHPSMLNAFHLDHARLDVALTQPDRAVARLALFTRAPGTGPSAPRGEECERDLLLSKAALLHHDVAAAGDGAARVVAALSSPPAARTHPALRAEAQVHWARCLLIEGQLGAAIEPARSALAWYRAQDDAASPALAGAAALVEELQRMAAPG